MIPVKISIALVIIASVAVIEAHADDFRLTVKAEPNIIFISGSGTYAEGTEVRLDSAPESWREYTFLGWKIDGRWSDENPLTIRMDRDHTVIAAYEKTNVSGGITIDTIPRISEITIDGTIYLPSELPLSFSWETGSEHFVSIQNIVPSGIDTRYIFDSWKDQNTETLRTIVAKEDTDYIALYKTQHFLKPITEHGTVLGGGWVDDDTTADFELESDIVYDKKDENIRYIFNSWNKGDYQNSEINSIAISDPETVRANWDTQYRLQLQSNIPDYGLFGTGWYEKGRQVALIAEDELDSPNSNIKYKFDRWVSKGPNPIIVPNSHSPSTTITVNEPYLIEAHYKKSYRVNVWTPFGSANGEGFYPEGTTVQINIVSTEVVVDPNKVRKVFTGWDTSEARVMGGADAKNNLPKSGSLAEIKGELANSANQNLLILADRPANVTAQWKTQYYLDVRSQEANVQGAGWYDVGRSAQISVKSASTPPGMWTANTFQGWTGDVESRNLSERIVMNEPKSVVAEWSVDNTPGIVNSIILGGVAVIGFVIYKKTHKAPTFGNNGKGLGANGTKPFDVFFNTKTRNETNPQNSSPFAKNGGKLNSIIAWLFGRK